METNLTLDEAKEAFQENPNPETAAAYLLTAREYWGDGIVGDETLNAAEREVSVILAGRS